MPVEVVALVVEGSVLVADVVELAEVVAVTAACVIDNPFPEVMFKFCINALTYIGKIFSGIRVFSAKSNVLPLEVADVVLVGKSIVADVVVDTEVGDKDVDCDVGVELTEAIFRYDINVHILMHSNIDFYH